MTARKQRIRAALSGQPVDRIPVTCWQHFPHVDGDAQGQIDALVGYQQKYDWDMVKLMFRSDFLRSDWGVISNGFEPVLGYQLTERFAVQKTDDWSRLPVLSPTLGALGEMVQVTQGTRAGCGDDIHLLTTAFSPIMVASHLSGLPQLKDDITHHPAAVHAALETIAETLVGFVRACFEAGADGLFFAEKTASAGGLSRETYAEFGHPYNMRFLDGLVGMTDFTLLHICGADVHMNEFLDYPVQALNWDHTMDNPSLAEVRQLTDKCLVGGIDTVGALCKGSPEEVAAEATSAAGAAGREGLILAPGCGIPFDCPEENLHALRAVCDEI